jgi:hypothetical protein
LLPAFVSFNKGSDLQKSQPADLVLRNAQLIKAAPLKDSGELAGLNPRHALARLACMILSVSRLDRLERIGH